MKIAVIGGGAVGLLVSSYLARVSEVTLYVRRLDQKRLIDKNGLVLKRAEESITNRLNVELFNESLIDAHYIFIAVKQYDLHIIMNKLMGIIKEDQTVIFLQNGMEHLKYIKALPFHTIHFGVVEHGALKVNDFTVLHTGVGTIKLASNDEKIKKIDDLLLLSSENFPILKEENFYEMMSKKLIVNAVVNPITSILKIENGKLSENVYYKQLVNEIIEEICLILSLDKEEMVKYVFQVIEQTYKNRSSMLKDLENSRKTEVDAILGFLLDEAKKKSFPCKQINLLYLLVKGLEAEV